MAYLQDVTFISTPSSSSSSSGELNVKYARLFDEECETEDRERLGRRMKAEMHLVNGGQVEVVSIQSLTGIPSATTTSSTNTAVTNTADSTATATATTDANTNGQGLTLGPQNSVQSMEMSPAFSTSSLATDLSDTEAVTPEMYGSVFEPAIVAGGKSRSASLETPTEGKSGDALGLRAGDASADATQL